MGCHFMLHLLHMLLSEACAATAAAAAADTGGHWQQISSMRVSPDQQARCLVSVG
jgi:hypothetical protein